jgi:hypothetical protein
MDDNNLPKFLSEREEAKLVLALGGGQGEEGFTAEMAGKIIGWAEWTLFQAAMVQLALKGSVLFQTASDDPTKQDITFVSAARTLQPDAFAEYQAELARLDVADIVPASSGETESNPSDRDVNV